MRDYADHFAKIRAMVRAAKGIAWESRLDARGLSGDLVHPLADVPGIRGGTHWALANDEGALYWVRHDQILGAWGEDS